MGSILGAGIFEGFFSAVAGFLGLLYQWTGSYGGAIVILTLVVMTVTAPLTLKSTRSMLQMQRHQPELKKLQAKYKDDRERLNQEMMAFYKENDINPLSGCVPVLMQAPIFIVLYQVLRGITTRRGGSASGIGRVAGNLAQGNGFSPWKLHDQVFQPQHLSTSSELYKSLTASTKMNFFGVDLSISPFDALKLGIATAIPFLVLVIAMLVSQIIQNRQIQGRNKNAQVNPQQQAIMKVLPFMLPIFSFSLPTGLGLYYFAQGLCRIGLQAYITRAVYGPHHEQVADAEAQRSKKDPGSSKAEGSDGTSAGRSTKSVAAAQKREATATTSAKTSAKESSTPKSAKSAAVQRKASGEAPKQLGRKSGDPRAKPKGG